MYISIFDNLYPATTNREWKIGPVNYFFVIFVDSVIYFLFYFDWLVNFHKSLVFADSVHCVITSTPANGILVECFSAKGGGRKEQLWFISCAWWATCLYVQCLLTEAPCRLGAIIIRRETIKNQFDRRSSQSVRTRTGRRGKDGRGSWGRGATRQLTGARGKTKLGMDGINVSHGRRRLCGRRPADTRRDDLFASRSHRSPRDPSQVPLHQPAPAVFDQRIHAKIQKINTFPASNVVCSSDKFSRPITSRTKRCQRCLVVYNMQFQLCLSRKSKRFGIYLRNLTDSPKIPKRTRLQNFAKIRRKSSRNPRLTIMLRQHEPH